MIEITILNFLDENLDVPVLMEKPSNPPERCVFFEKTSGAKRNHLLSSTFAFQSYGKSLYEAAALNEQLKVAVESMIVLPEISAIRLNSDYNFTDTETKEHRYQAVFDINHY